LKRKLIILISILIVSMIAVAFSFFTPKFIVKAMAYAKKENVVQYLEEKYSKDFVVVSVDEYEQDMDGFWPIFCRGSYTYEYSVRSIDEDLIHKVVCYQNDFKCTYIDSYYADKLFTKYGEAKITELLSKNILNQANSNISHTTTPIGIHQRRPNNTGPLSVTYNINYYVNSTLYSNFSEPNFLVEFEETAKDICDTASKDKLEININVNVYFSDNPSQQSNIKFNNKDWFYYSHDGYSDFDYN